jgi:outer membrane protein OmpA-like peptidoglycan-associated protein
MEPQQTTSGQQAASPQPPLTGEAPSPWTVINDYSKTVVTLGSALLAVTVTFSGTILGKFNSTFQLCFLIAAWLFLVIVIAFALKSIQHLINYLRVGQPQNANKSIFYANAAFGALVVSGACLLVVGGYYGMQTLSSLPARDSPATVEKTVSAMLTIAGMQKSSWVLESLNWNESSKQYHLVLKEEKSAEKFSVIVDLIEGRIIKIDKLPLEDTKNGGKEPPPVDNKNDLPIVLSGDVLFEFGRSDIRPDGEPTLQRVSEIIKQRLDVKVLIEGHTDAKGGDAYNLQLSERRAAAVKSWLVGKAGIDGCRITTKGWGRANPVAPNTNPNGSDNPEGRQKNRRVVIRGA